MSSLNPLTEWVIKKIETEYKEDVALLIGIEGHSTDGDGHGECFDYFVPATDRGYELSETFIIDGVGHDLYSRSWERLEQSVQFEEMAIVLAGAKILYARSEEDIMRFQNLQKRFWENLKNDSFVYGKALECMDKALEVYRSMIFEEKSYRLRSEAECIHLYLSNAVAFLNHTYTETAIFTEKQAYNDDPKTRIYHCPEMKIVPDKFFTLAKKIMNETDSKQLCEDVLQLMKNTRSFILSRKPEETRKAYSKNYESLADWYQELSLTFRRIRFFAKENMVEEAYADACYLQEEFLYLAGEYDMEELNLLDSFDQNHLLELSNKADQLEQIIKDMITSNGIKINSYASVQEFLKVRS